MRYRKLSPTGDYQFGHSQADFWVNQPELVQQSCVTRLRLILGEWFLDTTDGTAWYTKVLGKYTRSSIDPELRQRILNTPGVSSIASYSSNIDTTKRVVTVNATLNTIFGQVQLSTAVPYQPVFQAR